METVSALLAIPAQRPVTRGFDVFFDLGPDKRLSKHSWGWWFETPSHSLWRHRNGWRNSTTFTHSLLGLQSEMNMCGYSF